LIDGGRYIRRLDLVEARQAGEIEQGITGNLRLSPLVKRR
jgi:hypothetical protein